MQQLKDFIAELGYGTIATMTGRYYAMDRDKRWERVQIAYDGLTQGVGEQASDVVEVKKQCDRLCDSLLRCPSGH
jgi:2,3-bisphosphoglycerate-independent phosphoglycerate mutase